MTVTIKCELMEKWNYETCYECKRFTISRGLGKGINWRCKLNSGSAAEKREFKMIWAENYLINRDAMDESSRSSVNIKYVGKKKRRSADK